MEDAFLLGTVQVRREATSGSPSLESSLITQRLWRLAAKTRLSHKELVWDSVLAPWQVQGSAGPGGGQGYNLAISVSSQHQAKNLTRRSAKLSGVGETSAKGNPRCRDMAGPGPGSEVVARSVGKPLPGCLCTSTTTNAAG